MFKEVKPRDPSDGESSKMVGDVGGDLTVQLLVDQVAGLDFS